MKHFVATLLLVLGCSIYGNCASIKSISPRAIWRGQQPSSSSSGGSGGSNQCDQFCSYAALRRQNIKLEQCRRNCEKYLTTNLIKRSGGELAPAVSSSAEYQQQMKHVNHVRTLIKECNRFCYELFEGEDNSKQGYVETCALECVQDPENFSDLISNLNINN